MSSQSSLIVTNDSGFSGTAPSRDDSQGWRPIPFSPPPVPPPPGDVTDTEADEPPKVPPKPKSVKTNIWLTANQPGQQLGSPTSPPLSPTNGYPMTTAQQKGWVLTDMTTGFLPKSRGAALFERRKQLHQSWDEGEVPPPPIMDIPNNNNNLRKDEDEFWPPPPPPPDESKDWLPPPPPPPKPKPKVTSPSAPSPPEATRHDSRPDAPNRKVIPPPRKFGFKPFKPYAPSGDQQQRDMWTPSDAHGDLPPPPPLSKPDSAITAPVWTPSGVQVPKKEFKSVRPDLTAKSKASTAQPVSSMPPADQPMWTPPSQPSAAPLSPSQTSHPLSVDTLSDPSHILARGFASPQPKSPQHPPVVHSAPSQDQYAPPPPPPPVQAPYFPAGHAPPAPGGPGGGPAPSTQGGPVQYDGIPNGYGFIPANAVMSGSPGALTTDPTKLPPGALFQKQTVDGDVVHTDTFYPIQNVTRNSSTVKKQEAPRYDGIGPRDKDGMPLGLRQHVKEDNRHDWYKEMFKSIHKQDKDEDDDSSDSVFVSENETLHAGDSWKTVTQEKDYGPEPVVKHTPAYRVQPGKITDFVPGKSALATHEKNIQAQKEPLGQGRRMSAPGSGYGSDEEARKAYRNFVKSGQLPSQGLGLGAPPARRASSTVTKPAVPDSRYDYMSQLSSADRSSAEKKPREVREPDASYSKSLPEYNPIKSPNISDDRFDDFDFTPPVVVPVAKQEVLPPVERSPSPGKQIAKASAVALYPFTAQSKKELSFKKGDTIFLTREVDKNWFEGEHHGSKGIFPKSYVEVVTSIEEARNLQVNTPSAEGKGRAKYKFKGETANELSVNKGEIVDLVRRIDANWWEARVGGRAGIIPVAYLEVLREPPSGRAVSPQLSSGVPKGAPLSPSSGRSPHSPAPVAKSPSYQTQSSNHMGYGPTGGTGVKSQPPAHQHQQQKQAAWNNGPVQGRGANVGRPAQNIAFHHQGPVEASRQFGSPTQERYRAVYSYQPNNDDELELQDGDTVVVMEKCDDGWFVGFSESTGLFGTFPGNYVERL